MKIKDDYRPNPDLLLESLKSTGFSGQGRLKIFLGYAAGVGKTYAMLDEARDQLHNGVDVVIGYVEPHARPETMQLLEGLPMIPPKVYNYKNIQLKEFDLDAALARKPELILVDELAHANAEGVRNKKRYQDIEELLNAGIDVYSTVNVQHIESLNDVVQDITKISVRETIPDYIFDNASKIKLIDIEPEELLLRLDEGKIYSPERAKTAINHFFTKENLRLLREIAMRKAMERISFVNQNENSMTTKMPGMKMIVCVSCSPTSAKCIRWAARTAETQHTPWIAVYVEKTESHILNDQQQKELQANLELAERLGAEVVTLNGDDIATVISEYAKLTGITNIIIGKSRNKKSLWNLFELDLEDRLISLLPTIEIHIIPGTSTKNSFHLRKKKVPISKNISFSKTDMLKTLLVLTAATLICFILRYLNIKDQNMIMIYILSVLMVSRMTTGYLYGIIASVISVMTFNFFFTEPYFTFSTIQPGYPITFLIMLIVAFITCTSTVRIKTEACFAVEREHRTEVLYEINKKFLATRGLENIIALTNGYISKLFERSVIIYTKDPGGGSIGTVLEYPADKDTNFLMSEDERAVAHWVFVNQKRAGAGTDTLMGSGAFYMPVISQGNVLGVIGLSCSKSLLTQYQRAFLRRLASQVAMALERQLLSDEQRHIIIETEKEKMRSNLLRAISHDLRTPLTSILGASSTIRDQGNAIEKSIQDKLLSNIIEDSQWLIRMVENLLSVTRINEGSTTVKKTLEAAEEIVAEAIDRIKKRFPDRKISVKVPDSTLFVPMDGTLIEQVLINLIENAVKHSAADSIVEVDVKEKINTAIFEVKDHGEGIDEHELPYIFDGYVNNAKHNSDTSRGMGVGLSICMSIIKAHNGKMEAFNKNDGGAVFQFTLPLEGEDISNDK
jgi:two-component system, OmpR family, sensor histidine kinase KdpD